MSLKYWVWLSSASGVGPVTAARLLVRFGSPENVFRADAEEYSRVEGVRQTDLTRLTCKNLESANRILAACSQHGFRVLAYQDAEYPDRLRNIYDPPIVLYVRGKLPYVDEEPAVAVVGTRKCTPYGQTTAEDLGYRLARRGLLVVTGLARGVDTAAARGALRGDGRVIGVIGSGVDVVYPPENKKLFEDVALSGAVISEYPPGTPALPAHFPARNRIISGLSLGVAVLESPKKSGALITAARAIEQNRDVFSMPGNVDAKSCEGSNLLLREGAIPILSGEDIADEYADLYPDKIFSGSMAGISENPDKHARKHRDVRGGAWSGDEKEIDNMPKVEYIDLNGFLSRLSGNEKVVAETIGVSALHADEIITASGLNAQQVLTALTMLELKGCAARTGGLWRIINTL